MQLGQELDDQDPPREKNRLPPMVNIMKIASAKSQSTRGACHQPTFMGNNLTISETCLLFIRSRWLNVLKPLMIGLMVVLLMLFLDGEYGFTSIRSWCYSRECIWNLRIRLCCIASAKWNVSRVSLQRFDIGYVIFKVAQFEPISEA